MARGPDMREVELVESGPDADRDRWPATPLPGSPAGGRGRVPAAGPGPRRRRAVRGAAASVLLTLVVAGAALGADRREAARLAALADVPGVVAPIDGPVGVRWRLPAAAVSSPRWVAGRVIIVLRAPDGGLDLVALDPATGERLWRTPVGPPATGSESLATCDSPAAPAGADPGTRVLACVVVDDTDTADVAGIGSTTYATRARLVVLDVATGRTRTVDPVAATTTTAVLGPDLLLAHVDGDQHVRLARVDPRDGTERWTFRSPDPVTRDRLGRHRLSVATDGEVVTLDAGAAWVLTADGEVRRSWPAGGRTALGSRFVQLLPDRGAAVRLTPDTTGSADGEVVDVRAGHRFEVRGYPTSLSPDDGSLPDLLLVDRTDRPGRTAYDLRTGREVWTSDDAAGGVEMLLDGRVLSVVGGVVQAVDGRTGERVWTARVPGVGLESLVSDGRVVLASTVRASGGTVVTALDVDDGRQRWSTVLGTDVFLQSVDGGLYGFTPAGVVVLSSPPDVR